MSFVAPMGETNPQLSSALKRLSAAKHGKPRAVVEKEIFDRLGAAEKAKKDRLEQMRGMQQGRPGAATGTPTLPGAAPKAGSSFLDEWLAKRQQLGGAAQAPKMSPLPQQPPVAAPAPVAPATQPAAVFGSMGASAPTTPVQPLNDKAAARSDQMIPDAPAMEPAASATVVENDRLHLRGDNQNSDSEVSIKLK